MIGLSNAGGGGGLNFRVVAAASAPASPAENTIWIKTSQSASYWTIDREYPANPTDGELLITIRNNSATRLRVVRREAVYLYPAKAEQYDAAQGIWLNREAYIWRDGAWQPFARYLFRSGAGEEAVLDGWVKFNGTSGTYAPLGTLSITASGIALSAGNAQKGSAITDGLIDLSSYTRLIVTVSAISGTGGQGLKAAVVSSDTGNWEPETSTLAEMSLSVGDNTLNIEALTSGYVQLKCWQLTGYTVTAVRLE